MIELISTEERSQIKHHDQIPSVFLSSIYDPTLPGSRGECVSAARLIVCSVEPFYHKGKLI